ncbi:hypothetical protein MNV49_007343 [Pseudohyphozyma bogoriensis]|nr:hypothetical protein MNV49_007343 [Pseudohyphozyma bogoriensis]
MLSRNARDWIYLVFLLIHIPATLLVDIQALLFAEQFSPTSLRQVYLLAQKDDPLLTHATHPDWVWFQSFIILEIVFQLPTFFIGARGLLKGSKSVWPLLALYGASSATTTWACLATVITMPGIEKQLPQLLASYVPFFLVPFCMALDYGVRLTKLVAGADLKEKKRA